ASTRSDTYVEQLRRIVTPYHLHSLHYGLPDGACSQVKVMDGVCDLNLPHSGTRRCEAHLRYLYTGPPRPGPGRPKTYDGKGRWADLARFARGETRDEGLVLSAQVVKHVPCKRHLRVVKGVDTPSKRAALLLRTAVALAATTISRYDKARFPIALLCRDA